MSQEFNAMVKGGGGRGPLQLLREEIVDKVATCLREAAASKNIFSSALSEDPSTDTLRC